SVEAKLTNRDARRQARPCIFLKSAANCAAKSPGARMGRIFETRKATMFARWNKMAKLFTRITKDIVIAVKASGPSPDNNPALRRALQNARSANMPKDKVESAIKR